MTEGTKECVVDERLYNKAVQVSFAISVLESGMETLPVFYKFLDTIESDFGRAISREFENAQKRLCLFPIKRTAARVRKTRQW